MSTPFVARIAPRKQRRHYMFRLSKGGLMIVSVTLGVSLVMLIMIQSYVLLAVCAVVLGLMYFALRIPKDPRRRSLLEAVLGRVRDSLTGRREWDSFTSSDATPFPRPVGELLILGVAKEDGDPEQGIIRQTPVQGADAAFFTSTLEIEGRGDGERSLSELIADAARVEELLTRLSQAHVPIDEISFTTRARPGLPKGYRQEFEASIAEHLRGTRMAANAERLLDVMSATSDQYRTFATIAMPTTALTRALGRSELATRERIAFEAHTQIGKVSQYLEAAGFKVVNGLGPRRLGALIRHLYQPSWDIDDLRGIATLRDGFPDYPSPPEPETLAVPDEVHDVTWYHTTADVPATEWPAEIHTPRWMNPFVTDLVPEDEPSVTRAVTTSYRLVPRNEASEQTQDEMLMDRAESLSKQGRVTDQSAERQASAGEARLDDFQSGASGVQVSVRLTCSSPSFDGLLKARAHVDEAASKMTIDSLRWADDHQPEAMVLSLPLARGIRRQFGGTFLKSAQDLVGG